MEGELGMQWRVVKGLWEDKRLDARQGKSQRKVEKRGISGQMTNLMKNSQRLQRGLDGKNLYHLSLQRLDRRWQREKQ